jgi:hypothetical protein
MMEYEPVHLVAACCFWAGVSRFERRVSQVWKGEATPAITATYGRLPATYGRLPATYGRLPATYKKAAEISSFFILHLHNELMITNIA